VNPQASSTVQRFPGGQKPPKRSLEKRLAGGPLTPCPHSASSGEFPPQWPMQGGFRSFLASVPARSLPSPAKLSKVCQAIRRIRSEPFCSLNTPPPRGVGKKVTIARFLNKDTSLCFVLQYRLSNPEAPRFRGGGCSAPERRSCESLKTGGGGGQKSASCHRFTPRPSEPQITGATTGSAEKKKKFDCFLPECDSDSLSRCSKREWRTHTWPQHKLIPLSRYRQHSVRQRIFPGVWGGLRIRNVIGKIPTFCRVSTCQNQRKRGFRRRTRPATRKERFLSTPLRKNKKKKKKFSPRSSRSRNAGGSPDRQGIAPPTVFFPNLAAERVLARSKGIRPSHFRKGTGSHDSARGPPAKGRKMEEKGQFWRFHSEPPLEVRK